jgi:hypothetical protein
MAVVPIKCLLAGAAGALISLAVSPAAGQEPPPSDGRLAIHGYLTQAYARSSGAPLLGIPEDGTTDYRTAALQLRYALTGKDSFVVQVSHERFGASVVSGQKDDVELDWAFYEHRFSDATSVRLGKVQIPLGIYNEIRDVGTLLPLYRPPFNVYGEGAFTSETVDGFVMTHVASLPAGWELDLDLYYGGWDLIEVDPITNTASLGRVEDQLGVQAWVGTPLPGLRVGVGGSRFQLRDQLLGDGGKQTLTAWNVGVDGNFDRLLARAEYLFVDFAPGDYAGWYGQLGWRFGEHLHVTAQGDFSHLRFKPTPQPPPFPAVPPFAGSFQEDLALAVGWHFRTDLVAKLEAHDGEGYRIDEPILLFVAPPRRSRYYILSLSASF